MAKAKSKPAAAALAAVRARIDTIDADILRLVEERAGLARDVAAAKRALGEGGKFGLKPGREAQVLRTLLARPRKSASGAVVLRIWREMIGESLRLQGPFHLTVWGGRDPGRTVELARLRFGSSAPLKLAARPEDALAQARTVGGVAIAALAPDSAWWGRLLAEPNLRVFSLLPCIASWGPAGALAVGDVEVEPTGDDMTFWVTDATQSNAAILDALARDGVAAELMVESGGLKLFSLAGFYQANDARLARAPGSLSGVIGAAPSPMAV